MTDFKKYTDLVYKIIGAAMKVHSEMNWGLQVSKGLVQDDPSGIYPEALEGKRVRRTCPSDPLSYSLPAPPVFVIVIVLVN